MPGSSETRPVRDEPARLLATATQFPEHSADSKLRSLALLVLVALSTLFVGLLAAAIAVLPVTLAVAPLVGGTGAFFFAFLIILGAGVVGAAIGVILLAWTWANAGGVVLRAASARPSSSLADQTARNVVAEMAVAAGIPAPHTRFIAGGAPNAMAVGHGPGTVTIAFTPGVVDVLSRQQLQAVVAHEIAHVVNGDIRFKTFLAAILLRFSMGSSALLEGPASDEPDGGFWVDLLITLPIEYVAIPVALALRLCAVPARIAGLAASRQRELLADYTAVRLTRDPLALVEALQILADRNLSGFGARSNPLGQLFIVDPHGGGDGRGRYADHPSLKKRLAALHTIAEEMERT